jgi:hypothetical protein
MPRPQSQDNARTSSHENTIAVNTKKSFFLFRDDEAPWVWFAPSTSYVILPPAPEPDRATCYSASLAADDLLEDLRAALIDGDDLSARMALHTLRGLAEVVLAQLHAPSSSENRVLQ